MPDVLTNLLVDLSDSIRQRFFNPTRAWPNCVISQLTFNTIGHALNGVSVEGLIDEARVFGPADRIYGGRSNSALLYYALGLEIDCFKGVVVSFRIITDPGSRSLRWHRRCRPATLLLALANSSRRNLSRDTYENELVHLFGQPVETGPIGDDRVHTFVNGGTVIETYHAQGSGRLAELELMLSADAAATGHVHR